MTKSKLLQTFLLALLFGLLSCNDVNENIGIHFLKPNIGFDSIKLDQLTINDIKSKFGDRLKIDTFYTQPIITPSSLDSNITFDKEIFSFRFFYDSLGLSFFHNMSENKITALRVEFPFNGITDKGIVLNQSTFKDVEKVYGQVPWAFVGPYIIKEYDGICFYHPYNDTLPESDSALKRFLDDKVTEITISKHNKRH